MKKSLMTKVGASFLLGSLLGVLSLGTAQASSDHTLYDSLQEFSDSAKAARTGDSYNYMEPTSAGAQGPVRTDMMKGPAAIDSSRPQSEKSQWDELKMRLGPIGGDGTS